MQINQYTNEETEVADDDFLDIDRKKDVGYLSSKVKFVNLKAQLVALLTQTFQQVYDVSTAPQVVLSNVRGALKLRNNQTLMSSSTQEWLDSSGLVTGKIRGDGQLTVAKTFVTVDLMAELTIDFYPRNSMSIQSITNLVNAPTTTLLLNDVAYTLGSPIVAGDKVTINVSTASVVVLNIINVL